MIKKFAEEMPIDGSWIVVLSAMRPPAFGGTYIMMRFEDGYVYGATGEPFMPAKDMPKIGFSCYIQLPDDAEFEVTL